MIRGQRLRVMELKTYLGFMLLIGIVSLPSLEDYWKRVIHCLPIANVISRDCFRDISRYLHFLKENTFVRQGQPGHDCLSKVWPVIDHISQRFFDVYDQHSKIAVDEGMIKFQGRSSLKQYMAIKAIKRDIKVWVLGDSHIG